MFYVLCPMCHIGIEISGTKTGPDCREFATTKTPSHIAYQVKNRDGKKAIWTRIGSAWAHADGAGFNIQLDAVPIDGKVTLRVPSEKEE